jgi:MFS family permease
MSGGNGTDASSKAGNTVVAVVYSIIAVVASILMIMVWDLEKKVPANEMSLSSEEAQDAGKGAPKKAGGVLAKVLAAMKLWCDRPTVMLLNLIQVAFGVSATLLYIQVSGTVVQARFGKTDSVTVVGFMAATTALVAALCQVPFAKMSSTRLGKPPFMILSLSAFVVLGALVAALPTATLGQWPVLVLLYVLQGIGRAGYEGANKAIYADFFPDDSIAAFGNVILFNGLAGSASSYIFGASSAPNVPLLSTTVQSLISCICGGLAIAGYVLAEVIHRRQKSNTAGYTQTE